MQKHAAIAEWFKDHEKKDHITLEKDGYEVETFLWENKEPTSVYRVRYTLQNNRILTVSGDIGEAVYVLTGRSDLETIAGYGLDYFLEKCQASEYGRKFQEWDSEEARRVVNDEMKEWPDLGWTEDEIADKMELWEDTHGADAIYSQWEWVCWCNEHCFAVFGEDTYHMFDAGMVTSRRAIGHWIGLKMAFGKYKGDK